MFHLYLEHFRAFDAAQAVPIRPLTLLMGENSSGKSSLLAALAAVCDPEGFPFSPDFNRQPFDLGTFETIATYKGGKYGRAKTFTIGFDQSPSEARKLTSVRATFGSVRGQPRLSELRFTADGREAKLLVDSQSTKPNSEKRLHLTIGNETYSAPYSPPQVSVETGRAQFYEMFLGVRPASEAEGKARRDLFFKLFDMSSGFTPNAASSVAPIRTTPQRVYDRASAPVDPAGSHIPYVIEELLRSDLTAVHESRPLAAALTSFGEESGLFRNLAVRRLGEKPGTPFQILASVGGPGRNVIDVGYGVSQVLPVIVQTLLIPDHRILLLQQPEVHLHPRAQAALGSFFADIVTQSQKTLVVETHSDFIFDRVRQEVAAGRLRKENVALLFFQRKRTESVIHHLELDHLGNILSPPPGYREFFLREEMDLLSRGRPDGDVPDS